MVEYIAPSCQDLQLLKHTAGYTGEQMAALASVASAGQWRKYTGGAQPRKVNIHMLFFMAARLSLPPEVLRAIGEKMQAMGAGIDPAALVWPADGASGVGVEQKAATAPVASDV